MLNHSGTSFCSFSTVDKYFDEKSRLASDLEAELHYYFYCYFLYRKKDPDRFGLTCPIKCVVNVASATYRSQLFIAQCQVLGSTLKIVTSDKGYLNTETNFVEVIRRKFQAGVTFSGKSSLTTELVPMTLFCAEQQNRQIFRSV
jgi:hypothetical protein